MKNVKSNSDSLVRRNALKGIGAAVITSLGLASQVSSEGAPPPETGPSDIRAQQPAGQLSENTPATKLGPERADLLTPAAEKLTKHDLLALGRGERTPATANLTVMDLRSIQTAFGPSYRNYTPPGPDALGSFDTAEINSLSYHNFAAADTIVNKCCCCCCCAVA